MQDLPVERLPSRIRETRGHPPFPETGTALANISSDKSCGSIPAKRGWGGARNRADRTSDNLTLRQCEALLAAAGKAEALGLRFNRHWTVHYERAGIAEADGARFVGRLLKLAGDYARRHGAGFAALWVREGGHGKGGHVHILLHLQAGLTLAGRAKGWVRRAGGKCRKNVSKCRSVGGTLEAADFGGAAYQHGADAVLGYLLKGASREAAEALGPLRFVEAGMIVGKRCGWTQNIGSRVLEASR